MKPNLLEAFTRQEKFVYVSLIFSIFSVISSAISFVILNMSDNVIYIFLHLFPLFVSLIAIVYGHLAYIHIRKNPTLRDITITLCALLMAYPIFLISLILLFLFLFIATLLLTPRIESFFN